jgi:hypothetical protein
MNYYSFLSQYQSRQNFKPTSPPLSLSILPLLLISRYNTMCMRALARVNICI